jgi:hypothetical protein
VRKRPTTANSLTNTPGLEPSSDYDSESDCDSDEDAQFVYIPANSPFNTAASTARTSSAYLPFSAIPFACDALAEEDPLFTDSPNEVFDEDLQHFVPSPDNEGGVVVMDFESLHDDEKESQITRQWISANDHVKSVPVVYESGDNVGSLIFYI